MSRNVLYTYKNLDEFNKIFKELEAKGEYFYSFVFQETKDLLDEETGVTIDISALVEYLVNNRQDRYAAINNFTSLDNDNKIIIREDLAEQALRFFPFVFDNATAIYHNENEQDKEQNILPQRKTLYTYKNRVQLDAIIDYAKNNHIPFANFSKANGKLNDELQKIDRNAKSSLIDITSMVRAVTSNNAQIIYLAEQFFDLLPNANFVVQEGSVEDTLENFRFNFDTKKNIIELYPDINLDVKDSSESKKESLIKITDLTREQLNTFIQKIFTELIGHGSFKERFSRELHNFVMLNRIKEKKILSVFLLGQSGLGKTEVARIIKNALNPNTSLVKINFGNYSSQDALNSLIGSPAGYIGCDSGELGLKVSKSKAGIIVCDEFEKATRPIYNFFLELLEDGSFTDSMTREYDLNGYVIVFTSNIPSANDFYKIIPPELQSRIDLVCEFKPLNNLEKLEYVNFQLDKYMERLVDEFAEHKITPEIKCQLTNVNYKETDNLRDVKRMVEKNVIEFLESDGTMKKM